MRVAAGSGVDWALIAIFVAIVAVAALLFGMISVAAPRRRYQAQGSRDRRISHVVREAEWIHDQASLDLVATPTPRTSCAGRGRTPGTA